MLYIVNEMTLNGYNPYSLDLLYLFAILLGILVTIGKNPIVSVLFLIVFFAFFFHWENLGLKQYISEPIMLTGSSRLKISGFYSGKGKGRAIDSPEEKKPSSSPEPNEDEQEEIRKAIALSLNTGKKGESSKTRVEDSPVLDIFDQLNKWTESWKVYNDLFLQDAKLYNNLKMKLDKKTVKTEEDSKLLSERFEQIKMWKEKKLEMEEKLSKYDIDPSDQFKPVSSSDTESGYSSGSSYESRSRKRVKYSSEGSNSNFSLGFIGFNFTPILRTLSSFASVILLLVVHFNIFPDLDLSFVNLSDLLFLFLIINITKLIYKWFSVVETLYNHYLSKDYITIYFNLYFFVVIILLCFSSNSGIYIF